MSTAGNHVDTLPRILPLLTIVLAISTCVYAQDCSNDLEYAFGPCDEGMRTAYPYWTETGCQQTAYLPSTVPGLNCSHECPPGTRLAINHASEPKSLRCEKCPAGTYSVGGGDIYSDWVNMPIEFHTDCFEFRNGGWRTRTQCSPWQVEGPFIHSGDNRDVNNIISILYLTLVFVKDGYVQFRWRAEGERSVDGLIFTVDDITQGFGFQSTQLDWVESIRFPIKKGAHTLKWEYYKDVNVAVGKDRGELQSIKVVGTRAADLICEKCEHGVSVPGSDKCSACGADEYTDTSLDGNACVHCPPGNFSFPGSIGLQSCKDRPDCGPKYWVQNYTQCVQTEDGPRRSMFHNWTIPHFCDEAATGLPPATPSQLLECPPCNPGTQRVAGAVGEPAECQYCPHGQYGDGSGCQTCGAGKQAAKQLYFTNWFTWPQGFKRTCSAVSVNGKCPDQFGWQVDSDRIVSGHNHFSHTDITLTYNVEVVDAEGKVSFKYRIENAKPYAGLAFYVDGALYGPAQRREATITILTLVLLRGNHTVTWNYNRRAEGTILEDFEDRAIIQEIVFTGTEEGGAKECLPCKKGFFAKDSTCQLCPAGSYTDAEGQSECKPCQPGQYQDREGQSVCLNCGPLTTSGQGATHCTSSGTLEYTPPGNGKGDSNSTMKFNLAPLIREDNNLWGPLPLDPDSGGRARTLQVGLLTTGHALFANRSHVGQPQFSVEVREMHVTRGEPLCTGPSGYACAEVRNGGRVPSITFRPFVSSMGDDSVAIDVIYREGDPCPDDPVVKLSTRVSLYCALEAGEGAPFAERQSLTNNTCRFDVVWNTVYACPLCSQNDYTAIRGAKCDDDGTREITFVRSRPCSGGLALPAPTTENCTFILYDTGEEARAEAASNKQKAVYFGIGGVVFFVLCLALVGLWVRSHKHGARVEAELKNLKADFGDSLLRAANDTGAQHDEEVLLARIDDIRVEDINDDDE